MTHCTSHTANSPYTATHQATTLRITADNIHAHHTVCQSILYTKEDYTVQDHTTFREPKNHT